MLMAQATNSWGSTPEQVGVWIACMCGALGAAVLVLMGINQYRMLVKKPQRPKRLRIGDDRFVTRGEHRECVERISREHRECSERHSRELKELEEYTHKRCHDFNSELTKVSFLAVGQKDEMRKMIDQALDPVEKKLDKLVSSMAHVTAKLKVETCDEDC